jgi:hypothetical protein
LSRPKPMTIIEPDALLEKLNALSMQAYDTGLLDGVKAVREVLMKCCETIPDNPMLIAMTGLLDKVEAGIKANIGEIL